MIDIHTHIIPGFDDGSRSLKESMEMARFEVLGGTKVMLATPHVESEASILDSRVILDKVEMLNAEFNENRIPLKVIAGAELFPAFSILKGLDQGLPITLGPARKHVLIDLPHSVLPNDFNDILFEIQSRGVTPILAHPERCPVFQQDPDAIIPFRERGIVFQMNMGSFEGRHGAKAKEVAEWIFKVKGAHFLASDAHRKRTFNLGYVMEKLRELDPSYTELLTRCSGQAVLDGETLPELAVPEAPKKKGWLSKLFFSLA